MENNNYKVALNDQSIAVNTCFSTGSILFWVQQINKLRSLAIAYSPNLEKRIETANGSVMCDYMITLTSLHVSVHWKADLSLFYSLFEISGRWKFDSPI